MSKSKCLFLYLSYLLAFCVVSCATPPPKGTTPMLTVETGLPESRLSYYSDPFDSPREDLWEEGQVTYTREQEANFRRADMGIENGKLKIKTKIGSFSRNGLITKYAFRGDFDIQIDCHMLFLKEKVDMDQRIIFVVLEKDKELRDSYQAAIQFRKKPNAEKGFLNSYYFRNRQFHPGRSMNVNSFHGTLRFARMKEKITTMYKAEGSRDWTVLNTFPCTTNDLKFAMGLQNFMFTSTQINSNMPFQAEFDNFRVNAAKLIIEDQI